MSDSDLSILGNIDTAGGKRPFGISRSDWNNHIHIIGKTGSGKSATIANLLIQAAWAGDGFALIDPHGDLAIDVLRSLPKWRTNDVVYLDLSDTRNPIGINILDNVSPSRRPFVTESVVGIFKHLWGNSWGPKLENFLRKAVASLLECPGSTLLGIDRLYQDAVYRQWVVRQIKDPFLRLFWEREFEKYKPQEIPEQLASLHNKTAMLSSSPAIRNIIGQSKSSVSAKYLMDTGKIFIANLSKGRIGEEGSNFLGSMLVMLFHAAALERANVRESERRPFLLAIDEFESFTTTALSGILSEARKYRLGLLLSHQLGAQIGDEVMSSVWGNVGSVISFRVGSLDAERLSRELAGVYAPTDFTDLRNFEVIARIGNNTPFKAKTIPPIKVNHCDLDTILRVSRQRYSSRRKKVEANLRRWLKYPSLPPNPGKGVRSRTSFPHSQRNGLDSRKRRFSEKPSEGEADFRF